LHAGHAVNNDVKQIIAQGDRLFDKRVGLMSLWQEIAENFFPEVAEFTMNRTLGSDFSENLMSSYPVLARRELGDGFGAMLRPGTKDWFKMGAAYREPDLEGRAWLERATKIQKRAMYDRKSQFTRATKEGDHFYAAFGQCVITVEMRKNLDGLLFRSWHLRDVAWCDNAEGVTDTVHHKMRHFTVQQLDQMFPGKLAPSLQQKLKDDPYAEHEIRRVVMPSETYSGERPWRTKFVSLYVDPANNTVLEEMGQRTHPYVIPRWRTKPGSQYAHSPAAMTALPDARQMQIMTLAIVEASENGVTPPMVANKEVFRSDFPRYAGGVTWADMAYDGKISDHFAMLSPDKSGIPMGMELRADLKDMITQAYYLNKLNLPSYDSKAMTAYEFAQRVQEYIRQVLPLFEPMEAEYNGPLCDRAAELLLAHGAFGPPDQIPQSLGGAELEFTFESPLSEAIEKQKVTVFRDNIALAGEVAALDPAAPMVFSATQAFRAVLEANGSPADWINSEETVQAMQQAHDQQMQQQQLLDSMGKAAAAAKDFSAAGAAEPAMA
jgi:hypothetical protein